MENRSYESLVASSQAPYINQLIAECGAASNFHGEAHPSLPNYIAMTSGSTQGITDDEPPAVHPLNVPSIFSLLSGGGARSLEESMPSACSKLDAGLYAVRHNPQTYYANLGDDCNHYNVPLSDPVDVSARFTFITPNLIHDMHDGTVADGDGWLRSFLPKLVATPQYSAGRAAIFVTWDEADGGGDNHILTLVIAPSVVPGTRVAAGLDHYSLLRATQEMLSLTPLLGNAATATDMRHAFNI